MSSSTRPGLLLNQGVRSEPVALVVLARWRDKPTLDTLCASSIGLDRDEGARVFSPYFNSLPLASLVRVSNFYLPINLFHCSHDLAQNSIDTYQSALGLTHMRGTDESFQYPYMLLGRLHPYPSIPKLSNCLGQASFERK
jgi:hypothetical protein